MSALPGTPASLSSPSGESARSAPVPALAASPKPFSSGWTFWTLFLALIALGAFLRFWRLDFQAYWQDEAYTVNRIRGSYAFLLDQLSDQGFPPGWYSLLRFWRIFGEVHLHLPAAETYQPGFLRLVPAFFGTLTVPAMYFLARQFTDRRGALLVLLLAAVNPFLIYYSRDIKMYAGIWFFVTLNMALFFHWQTTRKHLLYFPLFLLSGVAMTTMHDTGLIIIALQFIFILTRPRPKAWDAPLWILAAAAAGIIPYYWHYVVNNPAVIDARISNTVDRGMVWIQDYTDMSWQTIAGLPTAHLFGYLWPVYPPAGHMDNWNQIDDWNRINDWFFLGGDDYYQHLAQRSWAWMAHGQLYAAFALFAVLLLGLFPWRRFRLVPWRIAWVRKPPNPERENSCTRGRWWWVFLWVALPTTALACTWMTTPGEINAELTESKMEQSRLVQSLQSARRTLAAMPENSPNRAPQSAEITRQEQALQQVEQEITQIRARRDTDWYGRVWHGLTPKPLWEPRYLGIIVPAWLLWLAASLRRLPTWPLRTLLITATAAVCTWSSLSNHLTYRNAPFNREAAILEKYIDPNNRLSAAVAIPEVKFPDPAENMGTTIARHLVPFSAADNAYVPWTRSRVGRDPSFWPLDLSSPNGFVDWLKTAVANNPRIKLLVLTDRYGEMTDPKDALSSESIAKIIGPRWQLVDTQIYTWHYEWRFYIFHTWRTRVWKLVQ